MIICLQSLLLCHDKMRHVIQDSGKQHPMYKTILLMKTSVCYVALFLFQNFLSHKKQKKTVMKIKKNVMERSKSDQNGYDKI